MGCKYIKISKYIEFSATIIKTFCRKQIYFLVKIIVQVVYVNKELIQEQKSNKLSNICSGIKPIWPLLTFFEHIYEVEGYDNNLPKLNK